MRLDKPVSLNDMGYDSRRFHSETTQSIGRYTLELDLRLRLHLYGLFIDGVVARGCKADVRKIRGRASTGNQVKSY